MDMVRLGGRGWKSRLDTRPQPVTPEDQVAVLRLFALGTHRPAQGFQLGADRPQLVV